MKTKHLLKSNIKNIEISIVELTALVQIEFQRQALLLAVLILLVLISESYIYILL